MEKYCANHADTRAVAECAACAKPVCLMCQREVPEGTFCSGSCVYVHRSRVRTGTTEVRRRPTTVVVRPPAPCSAHPESPAVARCKVCEKRICALCVIQSPEGTFCSQKCFGVVSEVKSWTEDEADVVLKPDQVQVAPPAPAPPPEEFWVDPPAPAKPPPPPVPAPPSRETARVSRPAPPPEESWVAPPAPVMRPPPPAPAEPRRETARTPRTTPPPEPEVSTVPAGPTCFIHPGVEAIGRCERCSNAVCRACLVRTPRGTFCSTACWERSAKAPATRKGRLVPVAVAAAALAVAGAWAVVAFTGILEKGPVAKAEPAPLPPRPEPAKPEPDPVPVPKPEPPKPEAPKPQAPKPEPARHLLRAADPWAGLKPGAWFRMKTVHGGKEAYTDTGLRERGPGYVVLVSQDRREKTGNEELRRIELPEARSMGDLKLEREGLTLDLDLVTLSGREGELLWVIRDGPNAGAVLKREFAASPVKVLRIGPEDLTVKGRRFECLRAETEEGGPTVRRWLSAEVPFVALRTERAGRSEILVDFGPDWTKRPPFPVTSKPAFP